jgi:hypothetical protein
LKIIQKYDPRTHIWQATSWKYLWCGNSKNNETLLGSIQPTADVKQVKKKPVTETRQVSEEVRSERVNVSGSSSGAE